MYPFVTICYCIQAESKFLDYRFWWNFLELCTVSWYVCNPSYCIFTCRDRRNYEYAATNHRHSCNALNWTCFKPRKWGAKKKIQRCEAEAMGEMGGWDKGPSQSCESVAGYIRYSRSSCQSLWWSCAQIQRQQSQAQLPRKRQINATSPGFSGDPAVHLRSACNPIAGFFIAAALFSGPGLAEPRHCQRLLGILPVAAELRRLPWTTTH